MSGSKRKAASKRKPAPKVWQRKRANKIEAFVSDDELARFKAKCAAKSRTASEQLRFWINQESRPRKQQQSEPPATDPRQTNIEDIATRPEGEALREWAEREGRSDWLQENLT